MSFDLLIGKPAAPSVRCCDICGGTNNVKPFPAAITGTAISMCFSCFDVWYDGGETEVAVIREKSLAKQNP